jgi:uncharacterized membrane-anchored protein YhcB (DUF1043 family)
MIDTPFALARRVPAPVWAVVAFGLLMGAALGAQTIRLGEARATIDTLSAHVETLSADLSTCRGNTATLEIALADQNAAVEALAAESAARIARAEAAQRDAEETARQARDRAARFALRPIQGVTVCERVLDVDAAFLRQLGGGE